MAALSLGVKPKKTKKAAARQTRRARGTGAVFYSKSLKLWVARQPVGRTPEGRTVYRERRAATQAAVLKKLAAIAPPGPTTTVREWAERWYEALACRPSTKADYRHTLDRFVLPSLGHLCVATLTPLDIDLASRKWASDFELGPNTLRKNLSQLRTCLEEARRAKLITANPARDARRPRSRRAAIDPFTAAELARIITAPAAGIFAVLAAVGCRVGEAMALDVSDFDPATGLLSISQTYSRKHGLRRPKSDNGIRTVRVPRQALPAIVAAIGRRKKGPLFASTIGGRRQHSAIQMSWVRFLNRLNLRYRNKHQLRHSVATLWVSRGVPVGDVAKSLGDAVETVIRTYVHPAGTDPTVVMEAALGEV